MLNIDRLLTLADACPRCLTCLTSENGKSDSGNPGETRASLTCLTCLTEKPTLAKSNDGGAERPLSFEPLPGQFWLDPVLNGFKSNYKTMADLSECKGYPQACPRCRLSMVSGQCLLGPVESQDDFLKGGVS